MATILSYIIYFLSRAIFLVSYVTGGNTFLKPLSPQEEDMYIKKCRNGDADAKNKLIEHNLRLVAHIAKKYSLKGYDSDDIISIGTIGLIKGVSSYNPEKKVSLATYAARCIENSILTQWKHFLMKKYLLRKHGRYLVKLMITYISYIDIKKIV